VLVVRVVVRVADCDLLLLYSCFTPAFLVVRVAECAIPPPPSLSTSCFPIQYGKALASRVSGTATRSQSNPMLSHTVVPPGTANRSQSNLFTTVIYL